MVSLLGLVVIKLYLYLEMCVYYKLKYKHDFISESII